MLGEKTDFIKIGIKIVLLGMFLYHFWIAITGMPEPLIARPIHVAFVLFLGFLMFRASNKMKKDKIPWYDWILAVLGAISPLYILSDYQRIAWRIPFIDTVYPLDMLFGTLTILLILELTRRTIGNALSIFAVAVLFYTLFGSHFPGALRQPSISPSNLIENLYLTSSGLFGSLTSLSMAEIFMFIMFGAFLQVAGGEKMFSDIALTATKNSVGGPAKAVVVGSSLFGTISGSGVANVYATGPVTIPLMKKAGYKPTSAAAIEAVSSTLGQMIPPVMGATAFLIAEFAQIPYLSVAAAAIVPSFLCMFAIYMSVHFEAKRHNLGKYADEDLVMRPIRDTLKDYGHILLSVGVLIGFLMMRRTPFYSATMAVMSVLVISWLRSTTRIGPKRFLKGVELGITRLVTIASSLIAAGVIVSCLQSTGTVFRITGMILDLAGGQMAIAVILVALVVIILGLGLPPTGAFLIASVFGGAAIISFGVEPLVAYMFIFMFGLTSMITPPVCTCTFAAASIAESPMMKSAVRGFVVGIPAYIIPFFVIYNPVLLRLFSEGVFYGIQVLVTAMLGIVCLVAGINGMLLKRVNVPQRIVLIIISIVLIWPEPISDIVGLVIFLSIVGWQYFSMRSAPKAA